MDRFPAEVLNHIFIQLHLEQKIECMLVCHKWAHLIRTLDLLHTVILPSTNFYSNAALLRFSSLVATVQQNPSYGVQVERLILDRCLNEKFDTTLLPTLFPRLRFLCLNQARMPSALDLRNGEFESWQNNLETVVDVSSTLFVPCMLTTGVFRHLTAISLFQYYGSHFLELNMIIDGLKNAPSLNRLKLGHFYYYFHHFNMIHQAAPLLKSLSVSGVLLNDNSLFQFINTDHPDVFNNANDGNDASLARIKQNHCLKILSIEGDAYLLEQFLWIKYIAHKYTNLVNFTFNCNIPSPQNEQDDTRAHHGLYLKFIMPLFGKLGSQLKLFQFSNHRLTPDLYRLFDNDGLQLESLQLNIGASHSLIHALVASNQGRFLQHLSLYLDIVNMDELKPIKLLETLKNLELKFRQKETSALVVKYNKRMALRLNILLREQCPDHLESLYLEHAVLYIDSESGDSGSYSFLRTFQFTTCEVTRDIFPFIANRCPNLHSLSVLDCLPERLSIDLSYHNLLYVNIETKERAIFKIITMKNSCVYKKSCHQLGFISHLQDNFGRHDWPVYATRKSDQDTFKALIDIHLTCKSIHTLFLNKRLAL
ncbi:hypothetical protein K501DRAFT_337806 [Backusella circina FSU 941]|nr:hypothetical protein K501DRAFT_337806 [Backusella circina FSU 941]